MVVNCFTAKERDEKGRQRIYIYQPFEVVFAVEDSDILYTTGRRNLSYT